jgi:competence protein ComEA
MFKSVLAGALALMTTLSMAAVDVNKASVADLDSIKGIGPGTSAKVLKAREQAVFKDWADLIQRVGGIGHKKAAQLSDNGLTVNGQCSDLLDDGGFSQMQWYLQQQVR